MQNHTFNTATLFRESKVLLLLALPIMANGLLESSYGFTNTFMVAHLGTQALAVNSVISLLFVTLMIIFWGIISSTSILISHQHGAENIPAIRSIIRDTLLLALYLSVPGMLFLWYAPDIFIWLGLPAETIKIGEKYLHVLALAVPSDLLGLALMQFFTGISRPRVTLAFTLLYIPLLISTNYVLIFGKWHFPALGLVGIGWGTLIAYSLVLAGMTIYIFYHPDYQHFFQFSLASKKRYFGALLRVGLPLGSMYSIEIGYFFMLAILMGKISTIALAANQIVMQYLWVAMNVVFSIGQAISIRVGWRMGRQEPKWIRPLTKIGLTMIFIFTLTIGFIYWLFPHYLIAFDLGFHADPTLQKLAVTFFIFAALFQIAEGPRIACFSVLRGLKDTKFTMINSIFTFWGIALLLGGIFTFFSYNRNPNGLWFSLIFSAAVGFGILAWRVKHKTI